MTAGGRDRYVVTFSVAATLCVFPPPAPFTVVV